MKIQLLAAGAVLFFGNLFGQTFTNYTSMDGLLSDNVNCLDVDGSDNLWFGTQNGVSVFDGVTWTDHTTTTDAGLVDNTIQAIYVANSGDVWVGTDFGASVYNGVSWSTYTTADGLGNNQIKCISEDQDGDIWFGTNSGATEFTGSVWTSYGTAEGLPFGGVTAITVHSNGDLWMGTGLGGVKIFDGVSFTGITSADGLVDDRVRSIIVDQQNNKWIGTSEGISVFNSSNAFSTNHTIIFTLPPPDTLNPIEDLKMDSQGNIWAGVYVDYLVTEGGVCAYNGNQWVEYHVADGLVGPVVRALAIDGNDDVWVATSTGVSKISDPSVGIDIKQENSFSLYPNPAWNLCFLQLKNNSESGVVEIYNASMQLVMNQKYLAGQLNIELAVDKLNSGMYFVKANGSTQKLILR